MKIHHVLFAFLLLTFSGASLASNPPPPIRIEPPNPTSEDDIAFFIGRSGWDNKPLPQGMVRITGNTIRILMYMPEELPPPHVRYSYQEKFHIGRLPAGNYIVEDAWIITAPPAPLPGESVIDSWTLTVGDSGPPEAIPTLHWAAILSLATLLMGLGGMGAVRRKG